MLKRISLALVTAIILAIFAWQLSRSTTYQLFGDIIARVETERPMIALTFDDGPSPKYLKSVLDTLAMTSTPATFFLVGQDVIAHPSLTRNIAEAGHEIGNHSFSHPRMLLMRSGKVAHEIEATDAAIRSTGYQGPIHFRPPFGKKLVVLPYYLSQKNRASIMWDIELKNGAERLRKGPNKSPKRQSPARSSCSISCINLAKVRGNSCLS